MSNGIPTSVIMPILDEDLPSLNKEVGLVRHETGSDYLRQIIADVDFPSLAPINPSKVLEEAGLFGCSTSFLLVDADNLAQKCCDFSRVVAQSSEGLLGFLEVVSHVEEVGRFRE